MPVPLRLRRLCSDLARLTNQANFLIPVSANAHTDTIANDNMRSD